jgi:signal transduction histidine kinase
MVLNVLYYAKDREVIWSEIGLEEITSSVANVLSGRAGQLGVTLDVQSTGGTFEGDANAVHAMLVNLVENSLDACRLDKKQAQHQVTISSGVDGDQATFDISDNGIGMDRETREKAFSLFFSSKGTEGTGLGMFIAHKIVTNHHGSIEIDSTPGQGTRFSVRLPRKRVEQPPAPEPEAEAATDEAAQNVARQQGWDKVL